VYIFSIILGGFSTFSYIEKQSIKSENLKAKGKLSGGAKGKNQAKPELQFSFIPYNVEKLNSHSTPYIPLK
jgi:hypothetical protein